MRTMIPCLLLAAIAAPAISRDTPKDIAALARATAGRSAGAPVDCIERRRSSDFAVAGRHLIFRVGTRLTYVNELTPGCDTGLARRALVFRSPMSRMCRGDIAEAVDPLGGAAGGSCALGAFVPWTRP